MSGVHYGKVNRILRKLGKEYTIKCLDGDEIPHYYYPPDVNGFKILHYPMVDGFRIINRISAFYKGKEVLRGDSDDNCEYTEGAWESHVNNLIMELSREEQPHEP